MRRTGIDALGQIPWGAHICMFYDTRQDLFDAQVPFFAAGLADNEFCLWAISEPVTEQEACAMLAREVPDLDRHLAAGRIEIVQAREWYLNGGEFDAARVTSAWLARLRGAEARGLVGMRASGDAFWLGTDHQQAFLDYERGLDASLAGQAMIALCAYSIGASRGMDVLDVAHTHNVTITRRRGVWEVVEAFEASGESSALTSRELQALTWVARGKSAWEIGGILRITKRTVDEHVRNATRKLGAANRTQAAAIAVRERIIDLDPAHRRRDVIVAEPGNTRASPIQWAPASPRRT